MNDEKIIEELRNTLRALKCYAEGWHYANQIAWPENTLGFDPVARNGMWLCGLQDILDQQGSWIDEPVSYIEEEN